MDRRKVDERRRQTADLEVIDVREVAAQVWRMRRLAFILFIMPVVIAAVMLAMRPEVYKATASIILEDPQVNISEFKEAFATTKFDDMTIDTQARVLSSPVLIHEVINTLGLHFDSAGRMAASRTLDNTTPIQADARQPTSVEQAGRYSIIKAYSQGLDISPVRASRVIEISYKSQDPYLAAQIANAHTRQYAASEIRIRQQQTALIKKWIADQVVNLKKDSTEKSEMIRKFQEENGMVAGKNAEDLTYQQISDISTQLAGVETRKLELKARENAIANAKGKNSLTDIMDSPLIQMLKGQSSTAHQELQAASAGYGSKHPKYIEAQRRMKEADNALSRETANIKSTVKNELATITDQEELLKERLENAKVQADLIRQKQIELQSLQLEEAASSKLLDNFLARYGEIGSQLEYAGGNVRIASLADVPMEPIGTSKKLTLLVILFLSALFSAAVVALLGLRDTGIASGDDIRRILNLRLLGIMPKVKDAVLEVSTRKPSAYFEEVKRVYMHLSAQRPGGTILITEAMPGEGKTEFMNVLATYLLSIGQKVLIVTADPSNSLSGQYSGAGLGEILSGKADPFSVINQGELGINVLALGNETVDFSAAPAVKRAFEALKTRYDFVLIDSPPVLSSTDAEALARLVDQVILVVAQSSTPRKELKKVAGMLRQFSADVPYALLSHANIKTIQGR